MELAQLTAQIPPLDDAAMDAARQRQDDLTKPRGSLGKLEELSIHIAGMTGKKFPEINQKVILTMAGDHGVVDEGVSAYPADVTYQMVMNFLGGGAAINVFAKHINARVVTVDMGVAGDFADLPGLLKVKIAPGTNNIARGPAMSRRQAEQALQAGAEIAAEEHDKGMDILATGDMGIGNTTPSAAIASVLTGRDPEEIAGRGTGVDDQGLERKIIAVEKAIQANQPDPKDSIDLLSKVGGFEIGGLTGAILYAAANQIPVVIDGFISTAAAMLAVNLSARVKPFLISAHRSQERGHQLMLDWLELSPLLDLGMRLGEGTGAALAISLVEASCKILSGMATFSEAGVSDKE